MSLISVGVRRWRLSKAKAVGLVHISRQRVKIAGVERVARVKDGGKSEEEYGRIKRRGSDRNSQGSEHFLRTMLLMSN